MKFLIIARDNMKKKKGNTIIFFLLVALAVMLLYVGISVLLNVGMLIDRKNESMHGADYVLMTTSLCTDQITDLFHSLDDVNKVEKEEGVDGINIKYFHDDQTIDDAEQIEFAFFKRNTDRTITVPNLIDEGKEWKENSIILPYYMKAGMHFKTGETIHMFYNHKQIDFEIYGFTEDIMFASPSNVAIEKGLIDDKKYDELKSEWKTVTTCYRIDLKDNIDCVEFENKSTALLTHNISDFAFCSNTILNYSSMKQGASVTAKIFVGILTVFSLVLIMISLVIIHFNINNTIEMSIRNIGILEAIGYRACELRAASYLEFLSVSFVGMIFGLIAAVGAGGFIGNILSSAIGLRWDIRFDMKSALISLAITFVLVVVTIGISSLKYNTITPLTALRNGIHVHNFKKNHIRLDKSKLPLSISLGLKSVFVNKRKNIVLCFIVMLLTFSMNMALGMRQSFAKDEMNMLRLTGIEMTDVMMVFNENDVSERVKDQEYIKQKLAQNHDVESYTEFTNEDIKMYSNGDDESINTDVYEDTDVLKINNVVSGRRPQYDNEIMVTTPVADMLHVSIGDTIYLKGKDRDFDYVVVGLSQGINHFGKKALITKDGYKRLHSDGTCGMLYVYLKDKSNIKNVYESLKDDFEKDAITVANYHEYASTVLSSINGIMVALCSVMMTIVIIVIALILVLMIKTQVARDQKHYGVNKALGYTTGQLLNQTILSYVPTIFIGTILGGILSLYGMDKILIVSLSSMGIHKINIDLPVVFYLFTIGGITIWSAIIAMICSLKIRKISPSSMIREL